MFDDFEKRRLQTDEAEIFVRLGGAGPPLLLLHGYPQNHVMWHAVASQLRDHFTLVIPDLRGYGESKGPEPDPAHLRYSKRTMAQDMVEIMTVLGYEQFLLTGHDRGGRVGYRLALDHPERVLRFAALDIIPTLEVWERMNKDVAMRTYHWPFLAQPAPLPERLIGHDPEFYLRHLLARWAGRREALTEPVVAEYIRHFHKPSVIEATCEDYRAGATVDLEHDRADRDAGRRIQCPTLVVWGKGFLSGQARSPLDVWRAWAKDVREVALDCGHFVAEEQPDACAAALRNFFSE
ncbi:MAG: alpha/beta hydrolase [Ectothiorhodospiraceae bacterium]|nr:alpha/beta hydrolase [Ectothiorhodospiraceae bacterium]